MCCIKKYNTLSVWFKLICGIVVLAMLSYWLVKYFKDEDLCLVDYKSTKELNEESLPAFAVCMSNTLLEERLKQTVPSINKTTYFEYIKGNSNSEDFKEFISIEYEDVNINLRDHINSIEIGWRNGTTKEFSLKDQNIIHVNNVFSGELYDGFYTCIGMEVNDRFKKMLTYFSVYYKRDEIIDSLMVQKGNVFLMVYYPNQFLLTPLNIYTFSLSSNRTENNFLYCNIDGIELLKRRNKFTESCNSSFSDFDSMVLKRHLESNMCRPHYITSHKNYPICQGTKMKSAKYKMYEKRNNDDYLRPCGTMSKIDYSYSSEPLIWKDNTFFAMGVIYPEKMKIITQTQSVNLHSLVGNIGGYIGLFLGL